MKESPEPSPPSLPVLLEVLNLIRVRPSGELRFSLGVARADDPPEKLFFSFTVGDLKWLLGAGEQGLLDLKNYQLRN